MTTLVCILGNLRGNNIVWKSLIDNVQLYSKMTNILNPYGNGTASDRIRAFLEKELK